MAADMDQQVTMARDQCEEVTRSTAKVVEELTQIVCSMEGQVHLGLTPSLNQCGECTVTPATEAGPDPVLEGAMASLDEASKQIDEFQARIADLEQQKEDAQSKQSAVTDDITARYEASQGQVSELEGQLAASNGPKCIWAACTPHMGYNIPPPHTHTHIALFLVGKASVGVATLITRGSQRIMTNSGWRFRFEMK